MGIDISTWRLRIDVFRHSFKSGCKFYGLKISILRFKLTFRVCTCLLALLVVCRDVEENPGPPKNQRSENRRHSQIQSSQNIPHQVSQSTTSSSAMAVTRHVEQQAGVTTWQRTISSYTNVVSSPSSSFNDCGYKSANDDIYSILMTMKNDMNKNNDKIISDLNKVNSKMDNISATIQELKADNESLRRENIQLKLQICNIILID